MVSNYDVAIIGGGPAGIMAAISASQNNQNIILIEKNSSLGKKLLLTGDGRCNITNQNFIKKETVKSLGKQGDFLLSALSQFGFKETRDFFEKNGLELEIQENGKAFPVTQKSKDVLQLLIQQLKEKNIKILLNSKVSRIERKENSISKIILNDKKEIIANNYILATGGKSYPSTGSTGDGFSFSESLGHTLNELRPALCPIQVKEKWTKELSGLSLSNIGLNVFSDNNILKKWKGDILFAHFGLTGPLILDISSEIDEMMKKQKIIIAIDLFPDKAADIYQLINKNRNKNIKKILSLIIPQRLVSYVLSFSKINPNKKGNSILKQERLKLEGILNKITLHPIGLLGFDKAMITKGGVSLKEIDSKTMKSKIIDNLFFAGEIIDLHGPCGGYNLQICWTTGYLAGKSVV